MIFVTADRNRGRLDHLTTLLFSVFPGSTIYQHADPIHVPNDALHQNVSGVFLDAGADRTAGLAMIRRLRRRKRELPIIFLSETEALRGAAMEAGASSFFLHPVTEQDLRDAIPVRHGSATL